MFYVLQENVFKESHHELIMNWMEKAGIEHEVIKFRPFTDTLEVETKRKDIWLWGSVSASRIAEKYGWSPGSMYNDNHDLEVYSKYYGENMLNHDGVVMRVTDPLPDGLVSFFARPTKDTKAFTGQVFDAKEWNEWVDDMTRAGLVRSFSKDTKVLLAPLKLIQQEVRCWVIGGKVVSASRYKMHDRIQYQNYDDETFYTDFAQKMADIYCPAEAFVIDVCLAEGELKVVEINCINCSGFYHMNVDKVMSALETHFGNVT